MKHVILEGFLGDKYGREWTIAGNTYKDIFGCITANYPEFREDLLKYYQQDGGLAILQGSDLLKDIEEFDYEITSDTIIITPVPEGSKSGGAKILLGALLIASFFIPGSQALFIGAYGAGMGATTAAGFAAAGASINLLGLAVLSIGVNLALTGLQQLLAPDPSVDTDSRDQEYLFDGPQTITSSGNPVPILCGEGIIGGIIMSSAVVPGLNNSGYGHIGGIIPGGSGTITLPGGSWGAFGGNLGGAIISPTGDGVGIGYDLIIDAGLSTPDDDIILYSAQTYSKPWVARGSKIGISYIAPVIPHEIPAELLADHRKAIAQSMFRQEILWDDIDDAVIGTLPANAVLFRTLDGVSLSSEVSIASNAVTGSLSRTLDGLGIFAQADAAYVGQASNTLADATLSSVAAFTGASVISGGVNATLDGIALTSVGRADYIAALTATLSDATVTSAGLATFIATSAVTLDTIAISSAATNTDPSGINFGTAVAAWDPDAGADVNGLIPDAIGSATMYARSGAGVNVSWNGEFNDNSDICVVPYSTADAIFGTEAPLTVSMWRMIRSSTANYSVWCTYANLNPGTSGTVTGSWVLKRNESTSSHELTFQHSGGYGQGVGSNNNDVYDTWEHIVITVGNANWRLYVNGVLEASNSSTTANGAPAVSFTLGGHYPTGNDQETDNYGTGSAFRGRIGDVRVFHEVLDATEIGDLYTAGRQSY